MSQERWFGCCLEAGRDNKQQLIQHRAILSLANGQASQNFLCVAGWAAAGGPLNNTGANAQTEFKAVRSRSFSSFNATKCASSALAVAISRQRPYEDGPRVSWSVGWGDSPQ